MGLTGITIFRLITATLFPVLVAVMFFLAQTKTNGKFESLPYMVKQIIIGGSFGLVAVLATEYGIPVDGAVLNVRNAAPLTSGLIFGWPSGIIAGLIGGVQRWFSDAGDYTRIACSISTFMAGVIGASIRKFMNDNKKASWFYGIAVGVTVEVLHMLLVFLTNSSDMHRSFHIVQICSVPMIVANSMSVMLSIVVIAALVKRNDKNKSSRKIKENLAQKFQKWLLVSVIIAFSATIFFTHAFQNQIAYATAEGTLKAGLNDVCNDIKAISDRHLPKAEIIYIAENRRVGSEGSIIICDENGIILSDRENHEGEHISIFGDSNHIEAEPEKCFRAEMYGEPSLIMYTQEGSYYIIGILSEEEAFLSKDASVYMLAFMELLVFSLLFATIFALIKRLVVKNIRKINESLSLITNGNLNVKVDVRDNAEFASLSDDINSTVETLKLYINEAEARFAKDLEIAKTIQQSALPSVFPPYPHRKDFSIYASMDAAKEVGGDFYDFYMLDENNLVMIVADVSGKGIPGAMFMMTSKTMIKSHVESGLSISDVFTEVNTKLCENNEADMFVTAWLGILNLETGVLRYVNAGHNPPLVKRKDEPYQYVKVRPNFILAAMEGIKYKEQTLCLEPGDEIYLYTDGVTEAHDMNNKLFGEERLLTSLNSTEGMSVDDLCKKVKADIDVFVGEAEQFDDITMLCVRLNHLKNILISTTPTEESISEVAAFVEEQLDKVQVPVKYANKLMIAVDEIYSNIVQYSGASEAHVRIIKETSSVKLIFADNGKPYNPLMFEEPDITASVEERAIGGLGIFMVRKMMDDVNYMYSDGQNILTLILNV